VREHRDRPTPTHHLTRQYVHRRVTVPAIGRRDTMLTPHARGANCG
jgi:hypothetical protein